ncbi:NAD(P)/FAD-dependent oxidoreductase [Aeromicrobium sp. IC_218]|uniref:dihydrolipoyl dehydrogenase family protein n=1 Tax=Aeromicrobium sp. IC_218 TaxID=2545468 RepID=UPI00103ED1B5|nr:NAD(P)/FAD-dependent oxidoreductase [Aeromicrobium sp. IC_218]TCI99679.1 NAD(P)/FAD-dependent oxidoreductase [Aeromicrobium sp. IC_218]
MGDRQQVDLVVVGLGPGGEALATGAAKAGLTVVAVDKHLVGGECPYYGCIPTKMMLRAADALAEARRADALAGDVSVVPSWSPVARRVSQDATADWDDRAAVERLEAAGATVLHGTARLDGARRVVVEPADRGDAVAFEATRGVVLNPGTRPAEPGVPGLSGTPYWTNRDAVRATDLPGSLVVVGGGPIGCELAQVFVRFGVRVTVVQHGERLLPGDEPEASKVLCDVLEDEGVEVLTGAEASSVEHADGTFTITLADGRRLEADQLLVAAGRRSNLDGVGLKTVGLDVDGLEVDERLRAQDGLWVIGDVTGHGAYTHVSMYQSAIALRDVLGEDGAPAAYEAVPHTTFTDPEVAGVGLTEAAARDAGLSVRVGTADLGASSRGFTHGPGAVGLVKLVEDADRGVLVGGSVVGPAAGEILSMITLAVHAAVPVSTLRTMIYAYPTFHRTIESALADLDA